MQGGFNPMTMMLLMPRTRAKKATSLLPDSADDRQRPLSVIVILFMFFVMLLGVLSYARGDEQPAHGSTADQRASADKPITDEYSPALKAAIDALRAAGEPVTYREVEALQPAVAQKQDSYIALQKLRAAIDALQDKCIVNDASVADIPMMGDKWLPTWPHTLDAGSEKIVQRFLDDQAAIVSGLDALNSTPSGRMVIAKLPDDLTDLAMPSLGYVRCAAKLKTLDAIKTATGGQRDAAIADCVTVLNIGSFLAEGPGLIHSLVYVSCRDLSVDGAERILALGEATPDAITQLEANWRRHDSTASLLSGMRGERAYYMDIYDAMRKAARSVDSDQFDMPQELQDIGRKQLLTGLLDRDELQAIDWATQRVEWAKGNLWDSIKPAEALDKRIEDSPSKLALSRHIVQKVGRVFLLHARSLTTLRSARVALAAERFRMDHGQWPTKLESLVPKYIDAIPLDPFTGNPLRHSIQDGLFVVHGTQRREKPGDGPGDPYFGFRLRDVTLRGATPGELQG